MRCVTTYFDWPGNNVFRVLKKLMEYSFKRNKIPLECIAMPVPAKSDRAQFDSNHEKLLLWAKLLESTDEDIIFLDTDMFCMRDFRMGMKKVKYVGITYREPGFWPPINGGVVFARNLPETVQFFKDWAEADSLLYNDRALHGRWRDKYAGINQASLGYLLEEKGYGKFITKMKCGQYNCVEPWGNWNQASLIHIKGRLRQAWMGFPVQGLPENVRRLVRKLRMETRNLGIRPTPDLKVKKYSGAVGIQKTPTFAQPPQKVH